MKAFCAIFILATLVATIWATATDYCSKDLCYWGSKHIACGHNGKFARTCPANAALVKITKELQEVILKAFNEKRNFIAGGKDPKHEAACRMGTMEWDDELAKLAELNVKQCEFEHDCHATPRYPYSGQNLFMSSSSPGSSYNHADELQSSVNSWYNEIKHSTASRMKHFEGLNEIGHFAAMMIDRNSRVGCGAATFMKRGENVEKYVVACNFGAAFMGKSTIYGTCSTPASECKTGKNPKYPSLCSTSEEYDFKTLNVLD